MTQRVTYVIESFVAGALTAVRLMAEEMARRGWAITIVHGRRSETPVDLASLFPAGTTFQELPWAQEVHLARDLAAVRFLRGWFSRERPSVIHLVSSKAGAAGRMAAWPRFRHRVAYSPQGWSFLAAHRQPVARAAFWLIEWLAARLGGTIVACSEGERALAQRFTTRCVLIENAVPHGREPVADPATGRRDRIVGTTGRICHQKDPQFFVDVVRLVARQDPSVRFVWAGDGELRHVLAAARAEDLPITVTGWLAPAEVARQLREWALCLLSSRYEGMPFAILEAFAAGIPVVARDVVGSRDAIRDGETGALVRSPAEAASHVLRYLDAVELWDRTRSAVLREAATRFAPARLGAELEALYDRIASRPASMP